MKFNVGTIDGDGFLSLDAQVLADTRALICASSGAGKSWLLRLIAEQVGESIQTIIIDPEGEFATLREKMDVLVVGENGDVQANIKSAGLLARKIAETGVSAVLDIYDLPEKGDPWEKRRAFVGEFLNALMNLPKSSNHSMLVIVDEAHQFAPEARGSESSNFSRSAINSLMSAGRKRGFGGILATQRISKIHKDSIADARNIFIGGTTLDIDQERAGDMLGMSKREAVALRDMQPGEFFCYGPATGDRGVKLFHSAPVKTTHPKAGQRSSISVPKASTKIAALTEQFGDLPAEAAHEIDEINVLKRENQRLFRELAIRPVQISPKEVIKQVEIPVITSEDISSLASITLAFNEISSGLKQEIEKLSRCVSVAKEFKVKSQTPIHKPVLNRQVLVPIQTTGDAGMGEKLQKAERSILTVLAQYPDGRSITQTAILAGYSVGTGGFNNAIGALRTKQYIYGSKELIKITENGFDALGEYEPLPSGEELIQYWYQKLGKAERAALQVIVNMYPNECEKDWIATQAGYTPGTGAINNAMSRLKTLELVIQHSPKTLKLNPALWS